MKFFIDIPRCGWGWNGSPHAAARAVEIDCTVYLMRFVT
jgi:hypothetical protein